MCLGDAAVVCSVTMPRGFLVKRWHHEDSFHFRDADDEIQQHSMGMFHPSLQYYDPAYSTSPYSNPAPLHTLAERLGFEPHPLYLYAEPMELSTPPPLDLSIKATPITPPATPSPSSPVRKRLHAEPEPISVTPRTPVTKYDPAKKPPTKTPPKKTKAVRRLNFDEDKSSPVSGTIIRELRDDEEPLVVRKGDIDPAFNVVEVTEEAKAELAKIENRIGDYICRLCKEMYEDAFTLAQHRCSRIVHVEYRCPECDKVFNCPANLASHRRWHKPRPPPAGDVATPVPSTLNDCGSEDVDSASDDQTATLYPCHVCQKQFRRQAYLRKHLAIHQISEENHQEEPHSRPFEGMFYPPPGMLTMRRPTSPLSLIPTPNERLSSDRLGLGLHQQQVSAN